MKEFLLILLNQVTSLEVETNTIQQENTVEEVRNNAISGYDGGLCFQNLMSQAFEQRYFVLNVILRCREKYFSSQVCCLRFLQSYHLLNSSLEQLSQSLTKSHKVNKTEFGDEKNQ